MNSTAVFLMPMKISGSERELRFLHLAIQSIQQQTDKDWMLILVDDGSNDEKVSRAVEEIKDELGEKLCLITLAENVGTGAARNIGIRRAAELGAPFILFNDADDLSHPRRLELVRKAFEDETVNVAYTSFDVIDENGAVRPLESISMPVREILDGHKQEIVEGENAWIQIATRKKYTNQTSCTAVRTSIALKTPFPKRSVSEDCHTWMRYGAYPGKFVFIPEIKNSYRICTGVESRSRSLHADFYEQMAATDQEGFEEAMKIARSFGRVKPEEESSIRRAFFVRLALNEVHAGVEALADKLIRSAAAISKEKTLEDIERLYCGEDYRNKLRQLAERV